MILIFYLFISIYFGRKNPLFYLLFPLALQQGPGAFIDQSFSLAGKRIFSVYDVVFSDFLFFLVFVISIFFIKIRFPKTDGLGSKLVLFYFSYLLTLFIVEFFSSQNAFEVLLTARNLLYIPIAYFLWLAIYHAVTRDQYESFLKVLFYVTPVSAMLYIGNSSGILPIFPKELIYSEVEMDPVNTLRDFATMPFFLMPVIVIAFQALLMPVMKINKYLLYANLFILPIALLFTFTRSLFIMFFLHLIIITVFYCVNNGMAGIKHTAFFIFLFFLFTVPVYLAAEKLFPQQVNYFTSRFEKVSTEGAREENVDIRLLYLTKTIQLTNFTSPAFGVGFNREYYKELNNIGAWSVDSTIPYFLYHTGWVGVGILYLIFSIFSIDSLVLYFKTGDWLIAYLAANCISLSIASLIMGGLELGGSVWTFMNLALYTTIKFKLWKRTGIFLIYQNTTKVPVIH